MLIRAAAEADETDEEYIPQGWEDDDDEYAEDMPGS